MTQRFRLQAAGRRNETFIRCTCIWPDTCREEGEFEVEELVGQCVLTLPNITSGDAGPYLVIFPGKVALTLLCPQL